MKKEYIEEQKAVQDFINAKRRLRELNIIRAEKITGEIGEWLVCQIFGGIKAKSPNQKHWDIKVREYNYQVKAHAKDDKNNNRWTSIRIPDEAEIHEVIIINFSMHLQIDDFYQVPWEVIKQRRNKKKEISWKKISDYRIDIKNLPNQEVLKIFS